MDRAISEGGMRTRAGGKRAAAKLACSASHVLFSLDLIRMLLPIIDFRSFVALRACCTEVRARIQEACEELIGVLERAAAMYVTPDFKTALHIAHDYDVHFGWLLQTPALAIVAPEDHAAILLSSYHLLQAYLPRLRKLALSELLMRVAARRPADPARAILEFLAVRLGMFREGHEQLEVLHKTAQRAVGTARECGAGASVTAGAHYSLAGFYTYHHRRSHFAPTLDKAREHLNIALNLQMGEGGGGPRDVATICSELVLAQVHLATGGSTNLSQCDMKVKSQLAHCKEVLGLNHPIAAKMLAVQARLELKMGRSAKCEELQMHVLSLRRDALGNGHEDTHRSAADIYARRRALWRQSRGAEAHLRPFADAVGICLTMLQAAARVSGGCSFLLSKSLQGMAADVFCDARRLSAVYGVWDREETLSVLDVAIAAADELRAAIDDGDCDDGAHPQSQSQMLFSADLAAAVVAAAQAAAQEMAATGVPAVPAPAAAQVAQAAAAAAQAIASAAAFNAAATAAAAAVGHGWLAPITIAEVAELAGQVDVDCDAVSASALMVLLRPLPFEPNREMVPNAAHMRVRLAAEATLLRRLRALRASSAPWPPVEEFHGIGAW